MNKNRGHFLEKKLSLETDFKLTNHLGQPLSFSCSRSLVKFSIEKIMVAGVRIWPERDLQVKTTFGIDTPHMIKEGCVCLLF